MKTLRGTRDARGNVILKGRASGVTKLQCPRCGGSAKDITDPSGKSAMQCLSCHTVFRSQKI